MGLGKPGTGVGVREHGGSPRGSASPQQATAPAVSNAQAVVQPIETDVTSAPRALPETAIGALTTPPPSPSSTSQPALPQHQSDPSPFTTQIASPEELLEPGHHGTSNLNVSLRACT